MRIGVNCGHTINGQPGSGAVGLLNESNETRRVGNALMNMLIAQGHTVVNCTNDKASSTQNNLSSIVSLANAQSLDLFISLHFNAGGGRGSECYTWEGAKTKEASNIIKALASIGFQNRGIKDGSGLYVVKNTKAPAVLVEICFVDNDNDAKLYNKIGYNTVASAICKAITGKGGVSTANKKTFKDTKGHWAEDHIQKLLDYGITNGDGHGNFNPDKPITRAEAAVMIANALTICGK